MATSTLQSELSALLCELTGIISVAASLGGCAAATTVSQELCSQLQKLRAQITTDDDLRPFMHAARSHDPSGDVGVISLEICNEKIRAALRDFVGKVALSEPDASCRIVRVAAGLEYVNKNYKQHLGSTYRSSASSSGTAILPGATVSSPTASAVYSRTPFHGLFAPHTLQASAQPLSQPPTAWPISDLGILLPLPRGSQSPSAPWASPVTPFPTSPVGRYTDDELKVRKYLLASEGTLCELYAWATGGGMRPDVCDLITELVLLKNGRDIVATDTPTVSMLREAAPNVTRLSIDLPIAASISGPGPAPTLSSLLIDEGQRAAWSQHRMAGTLNALNASNIPELHLRNALSTSVRKCVSYLDGITSCTIVDDGYARVVELVDPRHCHVYAGVFVTDTGFLFTKKTLGGVAELTLCAMMVKDELDELFGRAFPFRLKRLRLWYGAEHRPQEARQQLLAYRDAGCARCEALDILTLTTKRPVDLIRPRGAPSMPVVPQSLITDFLCHIHGGNYGAMIKVTIVQEGIHVFED